MVAYRIEELDLSGALADPGLATLLRNRSPGTKVEYPFTLLGIPPGEANEEYLAGAVRAITGGTRLAAAEFIPLAVQWLEQRHRYALSSSIPAGREDVLVRWLKSSEPGHCEIFAGAFTLLARRAGFPVRIITGFKGGAWNAFEQYYMVRNSDAHAWCELYDEHGRWIRVDPTPGATVEAVAAANSNAGSLEIDRSWSARLDALRMLWYRRIVDFDRGTQEELVDSLKDVTRRSGRALIERLDRLGRVVQDWVLRPWNYARIASGVGIAVVVAVFFWASWRWRFVWWLRWAARGRSDPVRAEAGRWLRRFARIPAESRDESQTVLVSVLERLRYGAVEGRPKPLPVFQKAKRCWRRGGRSAATLK